MKIKLKKDFDFIIDGKRVTKKARDVVDWNDDGAKRMIDAGIAESESDAKQTSDTKEVKKTKGGDK